MSNTLIEQIDAILPQTQCGKCGFAGCKPYATAIAEGRADINQCPPGDTAGIQKLAALLGVKPIPLNTAYGDPKPKAVAWIDETNCIGCTFCIQSCPVDAIVGAAKQIHTVLSTECTGCELCITPCPVDCISMIPKQEQVSILIDDATDSAKKDAADLARKRYQFRLSRLEREKREREEKLAQKKGTPKSIHSAHINHLAAKERKKAIIQAAIQRAKKARAQITDQSTNSTS